MRAFITGATGMDGRHLVDDLASVQGISIDALVRDPDGPRVETLRRARVAIHVGDLTDETSLLTAIDQARPDVIYHLGAMSSPGAAWSMPIACGEVTALGTSRLLQAALLAAPEALVVVAGSIATHGPYGAAKAYARAVAQDARDRGQRVTTILMGGHHSPLRGRSYFSQKAAYAAAGAFALKRHAIGIWARPVFGDLSRRQDWGWAPDFMKVWGATVPQLEPGEYTLSTGEPRGVDEFLEQCFAHVGLDWRDWVTVGSPLGNPNLTDVPTISAQPSPELEFTEIKSFVNLVASMVNAAVAEVQG